MPSKETFSGPVIKQFVERWLNGAEVIIDPFARDSKYGTITNDLNPQTSAQYHMDSLDFLVMIQDKKIRADAVIFDPPYSPRQIKECYNGIGKIMMKEDGQRSCNWTKEKLIINDVLKVGGIFIYFGWDSVGMGKKKGFTKEEIMLVCHGAGHNDTICMAERKIQHQGVLSLT